MNSLLQQKGIKPIYPIMVTPRIKVRIEPGLEEDEFSSSSSFSFSHSSSSSGVSSRSVENGTNLFIDLSGEDVYESDT
jgi:hypothetical protein